jgi:peptidyl-tRNA hydrolase, PTH1 family
MNASGEAVRAVMDYYRIGREQLLVVVDDADLPLGTLRLRPDGSSGGHHGLESVEAQVGSRGYARLRLGIGRRDEHGRQITGHVLGAFTPQEAEWFERVLDRANVAVTCWIESGAAVAMNHFNGAVPPPEPRQAK